MTSSENSPWEALAALATVFVPLGVVVLAARATRTQQQPLITWLRTADDPLIAGRTYRWSTPTTAPPSPALLTQLGSDFDDLRVWSGQAPSGWPPDDAPSGRTYFEGRAHSSSIGFKSTVPIWTTA